MSGLISVNYVTLAAFRPGTRWIILTAFSAEFTAQALKCITEKS